MRSTSEVAKHTCGEPLTFGTDTNGQSVERCDACRYEARIARRAPSAAEAETRRVALGIRKTGRPRRDRSASRSTLCRGGCGRPPVGEYAHFCDECRRAGQKAHGALSAFGRREQAS